MLRRRAGPEGAAGSSSAAPRTGSSNTTAAVAAAAVPSRGTPGTANTTTGNTSASNLIAADATKDPLERVRQVAEHLQGGPADKGANKVSEEARQEGRGRRGARRLLN